tara:strand:- start:12913 stop:13968 length:1056 start_codon:yes stop_codon:yes gene_type:complete
MFNSDKISLEHCNHILELDYLREGYIPKDIINPLTYIIKKEDCIKSHNENIDFYRNCKHIKLHNYPELDERVLKSRIKQKSIHTELYKNRSIENLCVIITNIPDSIKNEQFDDIHSNMTIYDIVNLIKRNISKINPYEMDRIEWVSYIYNYKKILEDIYKLNLKLSSIEKDTLIDITKDVNLLILLVKSEYERRDTINKYEKINVLQEKCDTYEKTLNMIESVEIILSTDDDGEWLTRNYDKNEFSINMQGDSIKLYSTNSKSLLEMYSNLSYRENTNVYLRISESKNKCDSNNVITEQIQSNSSEWAYVFQKLYLHDECTFEKDKNVQDILTFCETIKLHVDILFENRIR